MIPNFKMQHVKDINFSAYTPDALFLATQWSDARATDPWAIGPIHLLKEAETTNASIVEVAYIKLVDCDLLFKYVLPIAAEQAQRLITMFSSHGLYPHAEVRLAHYLQTVHKTEWDLRRPPLVIALAKSSKQTNAQQHVVKCILCGQDIKRKTTTYTRCNNGCVYHICSVHNKPVVGPKNQYRLPALCSCTSATHNLSTISLNKAFCYVEKMHGTELILHAQGADLQEYIEAEGSTDMNELEFNTYNLAPEGISVWVGRIEIDSCIELPYQKRYGDEGVVVLQEKLRPFGYFRPLTKVEQRLFNARLLHVKLDTVDMCAQLDTLEMDSEEFADQIQGLQWPQYPDDGEELHENL
jgi:hypothetical protein